MLTAEEYQLWCQRLHLRPETRAMIGVIRSSQPVLKVKRRADNVSGRYLSPKIQRSIQFESQHVELWAIYAMERVGDVKALQKANERLRQILVYVRREQITVTPRSVQRWMAAYRKAEAKSGCGYLGLLDQMAVRGNRTPRAPEASMQLLHTYLKDHYATPQAKRVAAVYHLYRQACTRESIPPVCERTFYRERARFTTPEVKPRALPQARIRHCNLHQRLNRFLPESH